tara:strand:- start:1015 stop:1608 length:594 start_codon:yes stop_codon:yes gene_type:complete
MKIFTLTSLFLIFQNVWSFSQTNGKKLPNIEQTKQKISKPVTSTFTFYGDIEPTGYFDPLQVTSSLSEKNLKYLREAELHHSRIAMVSAVILPLLDLTDHDNLAINSLYDSGYNLNVACLFAMGMFEFSRMVSLYEFPRERLFKLKEYVQPGKLNPYFDVNKKISLANKELSNGRLAMIGVVGYMVQELITQQKIIG